MTERLAQAHPLNQSAHSPIVELLLLAIPTVAQMASYTIMQFIDTWMLSRLGGDEPTAVSNSGMMAFSVLSFGMGVTFIVNTLVSQSYGSNQPKSCGPYLWQGIWFGVVYALLLLPIVKVAGPMFRAFGHPQNLAVMEAAYFRIVLFGAVIKLVSMSLGQFMLGINRPSAVLVSAVFGVSINALAAWAIVLGHGGFKSMGVAGAAWAQNIGVCCEMILLFFLASRRGIRESFAVFDFLPRPRDMMTLIRVGAPSGLQWFNDILGWSIFCNVVVAILGPVAMEANTFMFRFMVISFMPAIGISSAVTALVGRNIGRGRFDVARQRTHLAFGVTIFYMVGCGACFYFGRNWLISFFTSDPRVIKVGALYLTYAAIYQAFDAMYIIYTGALRGAGDTLIPATAAGVLCWVITVGCGYLAAREFPRFYGGPWLAATLYGIAIGFFMLLRFQRGGWTKIRLLESRNSNLDNSSATLARS